MIDHPAKVGVLVIDANRHHVAAGADLAVERALTHLPELFIDVHAAIDYTYNDDVVILNGVENQVGSDDGTAKTRGEAGPFAPDEGEPGELIELLVDPGENLFGGKRDCAVRYTSKFETSRSWLYRLG